MIRATGMAAALLCTAAPAAADVIEIGSDGAVLTRTGAQAVVWSDGNAPAELLDNADTPPVPLTQVGAAEVPAAYATRVADLARRYDLSPKLIAALVWQESRWRPAATSVKGAMGLTQLMPGTAREMGVDPRDPHGNLEGGARYLRQQLDRFGGDVERALAAYNAGPGRVQRAGGVPRIRETQAYVTAIVDRLSSGR